MGTFDALEPGERFTSPPRHLEPEDAKALVDLGGYTHPLFTDAAYAAATPFGRTPLPGQALLLVMGGLVEQTERFDETTIALMGFDRVRFLAPGFAGDTIRVEARVVGKEPRPDGKRGEIVFEWRLLNDRDEALVEAEARMLFRLT